MLSFLNKLLPYCEKHSSQPTEILGALERETYLKTIAPQMLSGHLQGGFLSLLSCLMQPKMILEIGTFTGYASICLAKGLCEGGRLHTIEVNEELAYICRKYFNKAGLQEKIELHVGDAKAIIPTLNKTFDLVFIDAGKGDYAFYYDLVFDKVRRGGILLADNVLWRGKVVEPARDADTLLIDQFNKKVQQDPRVENLLLSLRDGLMIARKL